MCIAMYFLFTYFCARFDVFLVLNLTSCALFGFLIYTISDYWNLPFSVHWILFFCLPICRWNHYTLFIRRIYQILCGSHWTDFGLNVMKLAKTHPRCVPNCKWKVVVNFRYNWTLNQTANRFPLTLSIVIFRREFWYPGKYDNQRRIIVLTITRRSRRPRTCKSSGDGWFWNGSCTEKKEPGPNCE